MQELIKVSEVSARYGISTRTLRYYEDMGLIRSERIDGYAYRMYGGEALMRIEQILVLRKLNISIRDIQSIFSTDSSKTVLDILTKKAQAIDEEVALLHELKQIVLDFIGQIEGSDFNRQEDVSRLYKKADELERMLLNVSYEGNASQAADFLRIASRMRKLLAVRVIELPARRIAFFNDIGDIPGNIRDLNNAFYPARFSWFNRFTCSVEDFVVLPEGFTAAEGMRTGRFPGGMYAVAVLQGDSDWGIETDASLIYRWVGENGYALRQEAHLMWNNLPATGNSPPLLEMYVPIALDRAAAGALAPASETIDGLLQELTIERTAAQELASLVCEHPAVAAVYGGELSLFNEGNDVGGMFTPQEYSFPLMVRLRAKTDSTNIRLGFAAGGLVFNWGVAADSLIGRDISNGSFFHHEPGGYIPINEYADIIWILERSYMAVAVDGRLRMFRIDMPYMALGADYAPKSRVMVNAAFKSTVTVAALEVSELA